MRARRSPTRALTPALSQGERVQNQFVGFLVESAKAPSNLLFSLSLRERVGVRAPGRGANDSISRWRIPR
jgi:hypothetical protein